MGRVVGLEGSKSGGIERDRDGGERLRRVRSVSHGTQSSDCGGVGRKCVECDDL